MNNSTPLDKQRNSAEANIKGPTFYGSFRSSDKMKKERIKREILNYFVPRSIYRPLRRAVLNETTLNETQSVSSVDEKEYRRFLETECVCSKCHRIGALPNDQYSNYHFLCQPPSLNRHVYPYAGHNCGIRENEYFYISMTWYGRVLSIDQNVMVLERRGDHLFLNDNLIVFTVLNEILSFLEIRANSLSELFNLGGEGFKEMRRAISNSKRIVSDEEFDNLILFYSDNILSMSQSENVSDQTKVDIEKERISENVSDQTEVEKETQSDRISEKERISHSQPVQPVHSQPVHDHSAQSVQTHSVQSQPVQPALTMVQTMTCINNTHVLNNHTLSHIHQTLPDPFISLSNIAGKGLFNSTLLDTFSPVLFYRGEELSEHLSNQRDRYYEKESLFYLFKRNKIILDATLLSNKCKYINHSCLGNCLSSIVRVNEKEDVLIFTGRIVSKGEEFSYDYGNRKVFDCACPLCV